MYVQAHLLSLPAPRGPSCPMNKPTAGARLLHPIGEMPPTPRLVTVMMTTMSRSLFSAPRSPLSAPTQLGAAARNGHQ